MSSLRTRLRQGLTALLQRPPRRPLPPDLAAGVPPTVQDAWMRLPAYDQRHLVAVARDLAAAGHDRETVQAGLLHDIGKDGRITLPVRVLGVLLNGLAPALADRMRALETPPTGLQGLHLLLTHAERGAELLATAGMDARVVWLVRRHEDDGPDAALAALQAADNRH